MYAVLAVVCFVIVTIKADFNSADAKIIKSQDDAIDNLMPFYGLIKKNTNYERSLDMLKHLTKMSPLAKKDMKTDKRTSMPGPVIDIPLISLPDMTGPYPPNTGGMPGLFPPGSPGSFLPDIPVFDPHSTLLPLENFLWSMVIESSGIWDNGGVTVRVHFPTVLNFTWILSGGSPHSVYTKGKYKSSPTETETSLTLDKTEFMITDVDLHISLKMGRTLFFRFDRDKLNTPGKLVFARPSTILDAPNEVFVTEEGVATFTVRAPPATAGIKPGLNAFYSFLDTSSNPPSFGTDILYSRFDELLSINPSGSQSSLENVTIDVGPNAQKYGGTVSVSTSDINFFPDGNSSQPYIKLINAAKDVTVVPFDQNLAMGVAFSSFDINPAWKHERFPAFIRHGSIDCSAVGNPYPELSITKDGLSVTTYHFGSHGVYRRIYHPLDGNLVEDVGGMYTCTAVSGNNTISRAIFVG